MNFSEKYCLSLLRGGDYDRYISVLFAPRDKRGSLAALYAFNLEIARIRDSVKEPLAGEIRLRWWRDAIKAGGDAQQSPVITALLAAARRYNLPSRAFLRMCDARVFDLYNDTMPACAALETYYGETTSLVIQLACHILNHEAAPACADACGHGGVAQGASGLLRLLPVTTRRDQLYIPHDILAAAGTGREALRNRAPERADIEARARVVLAMLALAHQHYNHFTTAVLKTPASVRAAFLPLAVVPAYLRQAADCGPDVFDKTAPLSRLRRQWLMLRAAATGNFRHMLAPMS